MILNDNFINILKKHAHDFHYVVPLKKEDKVVALDLSKNNTAFTESVYGNAANFISFIGLEKRNHNATYLIGGYKEHREMYKRSNLFDKNKADHTGVNDEPRSIHLGIDIWGNAGTKVFAPLGGMIHSFAYNNNFGDYGATIILQHQLETTNFYTLYGHLALKDIEQLRIGQFITRGQNFAHFGAWEENGNWPPHLHFQVILDMINYSGDFPGVCKPSEDEEYVQNCPDPNLILNMHQA